jgi:hypothetical protein
MGSLSPLATNTGISTARSRSKRSWSGIPSPDPPSRSEQERSDERRRMVSGPDPSSTQKILPVGRNAAGWSRYRLVNRMVERRGEARSFDVFVRAIVPEPVFAWLEAADDGMTGRARMRGRVFLERVVTTPDMTALGAPPQVQPPTTCRETLDAAGSTRRNVRSYVRRRHLDPGA